MGWATALPIFLVTIYILALLLIALNELLEGSDKAIIKSKIEEFWLFIAELSTARQITEVIKLRERKTKHLIPTFIKFFWLLLLAVSIDSSYEIYTSDIISTKTAIEDNIKFDYALNVDGAHAAAAILASQMCFPNDRDCLEWLVEWHEATFFKKSLLQSYNLLIDNLAKLRPNWLRFVISIEGALTLVIVGIPLSLALLISFHLTISVLSRITSSTLKLLIVFVFDLIMAVLLPPLILAIVIYTFAMVAVFLLGGLVDYFTFDRASMSTFITASVALGLTTSLLTPVVSSWLIYNLYNSSSLLFKAILAVITIVISIHIVLTELFSDAWKFIHLNFGVSIVHSAINWAIFTDVSYSMYFVVPSILLVMAQRWSFGRRIFLNLVLRIADHPKGVLHAVAEIMMAWLTAVTKVFGGK